MGLHPFVADNTSGSVGDLDTINLNNASDSRLIDQLPGEPPYGIRRDRAYLGSPVRFILFEMVFDEGKSRLAFDPVGDILPFNRRLRQRRIIIRFNVTISLIKEERFSSLFLPHIKTVRANKVDSIRLVPDIFLVINPYLIDDEISDRQKHSNIRGG